MTPSQARNAIKRCFKEVIDPIPTDKDFDDLWKHFSSNGRYYCCYCNDEIDRNDRNGHHIDHLIPEAKGGKNFIKNRVLSCNICNGDLKRDSDWDTFLKRQCEGDQQEYTLRQTRINEWIKGSELSLNAKDKERIEVAFNNVNNLFCKELSNLRPA